MALSGHWVLSPSGGQLCYCARNWVLCLGHTGCGGLGGVEEVCFQLVSGDRSETSDFPIAKAEPVCIRAEA